MSGAAIADSDMLTDMTSIIMSLASAAKKLK